MDTEGAPLHSKKLKVMDESKWLTLPCDLLVDIFRRLDASAVIRCAGTCKLWRRAIVNNASFVRPRPYRFLPDLLLGFVERQGPRPPPLQLQYIPASNSPVPFLVPATGVCVDGRLYSDLLSSRDGFLLLGEDNLGTPRDSLCLCSAHTGVYRVLPAAEFDNNSYTRCMYVLTTGYDDAVVGDDCSTSDDDGDEPAVWILAVDSQQDDARDGTNYQIFSSTSGAWGPVKRSAKLPEDVVALSHVVSSPSRVSPRGRVVVCHGAVSWFVYMSLVQNESIRLCIFSMELRTGRTWTTELPGADDDTGETPTFVLAVSEDGRLSVVKVLSSSHQMEVWVMAGDGDGNGSQWKLRRTIDDMEKLLPNCPSMGYMWLSGFCPRSGYLFGTGIYDDQGHRHHFLIGVDGSTPRLIEGVESRNTASWFPFEMDWSTYMSSCISKMKCF